MSLTATENMDFVKDFFNNALEKGTSHAFWRDDNDDWENELMRL